MNYIPFTIGLAFFVATLVARAKNAPDLNQFTLMIFSQIWFAAQVVILLGGVK
jgi:hypothetical protein